MARPHHPRVVEDGQRHDVSLRSRDLSGIRTRGASALVHARHLLELLELIASIGGECWAYGPTAAALHGFDGFRLEPPFHIAIRHDRSVTRIGHVVHRCRDIVRLDTSIVDGVPTISATRTIIDLASIETAERLTGAIDSALRDGLTSEDFLHGRVVEMRRRGRAGLARLVDVLEGNEITRGGHSWLERRFLQLTAQTDFPGHRPSRSSVGATSASFALTVAFRVRRSLSNFSAIDFTGL